MHNLSPPPFWSTSWSGALHLIFHTVLVYCHSYPQLTSLCATSSRSTNYNLPHIVLTKFYSNTCDRKKTLQIQKQFYSRNRPIRDMLVVQFALCHLFLKNNCQSNFNFQTRYLKRQDGIIKRWTSNYKGNETNWWKHIKQLHVQEGESTTCAD